MSQYIHEVTHLGFPLLMSPTRNRITFTHNVDTVNRHDGSEGEGEGPVDGGEAVGVQRAGTPTVDATHTAVLAVEGQDGVG